MKHGARMFPQRFPGSHTGKIVSSATVSFCFQDANYAYGTLHGREV